MSREAFHSLKTATEAVQDEHYAAGFYTGNKTSETS